MPTNLPWGIYISPEHRLPELAAYQRFHPTFLYESVLCFAGFAILLYLARHWRKDRMYGDVFFLYGIIYPIIRFFTEFQRPDAWKLAGLPVAQWISIGSVIFFGSLLIIRRKLRRPNMVYVPGTPWTPPEEEASAMQPATSETTTAEGQQDTPSAKGGPRPVD